MDANSGAGGAGEASGRVTLDRAGAHDPRVEWALEAQHLREEAARLEADLNLDLDFTA